MLCVVIAESCVLEILGEAGESCAGRRIVSFKIAQLA
jgi:hypothetical protein